MHVSRITNQADHSLRYSLLIGQPCFSSLSAVLVNRLVLNLRQLGHSGENANDTGMTDFSEMSFAMGAVLGNIGSSLRDGSDDCELDSDANEFQVRN